ncbi:MAG TPA: 2-dehydropantoate 2-reductase [Usitatibacter sp.]|nr:2-dehydropantoate 2-reductase [Usitatibacter sp.]
MKACIVGAGAIGGLIGARLAAAGEAEVSVLARGATLTALREHGWRVRHGDSLLERPANASDSAAALGVQDLVVIAVKGPALTEVARSIGALLGPATLVMPAMNGVPWWFGTGVAALGARPLESVDPGGTIGAAIAIERVVGCVVHMAASTPEPGLVLHKMGEGLIVGEARGGRSDRVQRVADLFTRAGFDVTHSADVRRDIWYKLWGNLTMNPVSAMTGATGDRILADPLVMALCHEAMREAAAIGRELGCPVDQTPEDRSKITAKLGVFKTSMLQDAEAGRALELDAIVGVVHELGRRLGVPTPSVDAIFGLARLYGRVHGIYPKG